MSDIAAPMTDIERADTWDADETIAAEQVTYRIHRLRAQVDLLGGVDTPKFSDLTDVEQELAMAIGAVVVKWIIEREPDNPAVIAEQIHNVRVYLSRGVVRDWNELSGDERQVSIDLIRLVLKWLEKEGPR